MSQNARKSKHKFAKEEIMLILRSYQAHPASFSDIVSEIKENLDVLSPSVKEMYNSFTQKKLIQRVREKFQRLMQNISSETDIEIREELDAIKAIERDSIPVESTSTASNNAAEKTPNDDSEDVRLLWVRKIAKTIEEAPSKKRKHKQKSKKSKKKSTRDLIRENEKMKNLLLRDYLKKE